ncbi:MAG: SOS response-associated peptidase [Thermodesulfobacteriota bacterium]
MCGRFGSFVSAEDLAAIFQLEAVPPLEPRYNIAPGQPVAVVRPAPDRRGREMVLLAWGLIPGWAKDIRLGARLINARAESAVKKPAFRAALKRRRALVPADGFYEWAKGDRKNRPFWFRVKGGRSFAFAGLWEHWQGRDGEEIESCAILTTTANELVQKIHDRMPVILDSEDYASWLEGEEENLEKKLALLRPYPAGEMESWPVSSYVNNIRHEGPHCLEPLKEGQMSLL